MSSFIIGTDDKSCVDNCKLEEKSTFALFQEMFFNILPNETLQLIWLSAIESSEEINILSKAVDSVLLILQDEEEKLQDFQAEEGNICGFSSSENPVVSTEEDLLFESSFSSLAEEQQLSALSFFDFFDYMPDVSKGTLLAILSENHFEVENALATAFYMLDPALNEQFGSTAEYYRNNPLPSQTAAEFRKAQKQRSSSYATSKTPALKLQDRFSYAGVLKNIEPPPIEYSKRYNPSQNTRQECPQSLDADAQEEIEEWRATNVDINNEEVWRCKAAEHAQHMKLKFRQAASSYHSKTNGPMAMTIANAGRTSQQQMIKCNHMAALAALSYRNPLYAFGSVKNTCKLVFLGPKKPVNNWNTNYSLCDGVRAKCVTIDLHRLHVTEAIQIVDSIVNYYVNKSMLIHTLILIVGKGHNSKENKPKLGPALLKYLNSRGYTSIVGDAEIKINLS